MIFITIKSQVIDIRRQFERDIDAEKFLKRIKKIHDLHNLGLYKKQNPHDGIVDSFKYDMDAKRVKWVQKRRLNNLKLYMMPLIKNRIKMRVDIQNTDAAQLNFHHQLK